MAKPPFAYRLSGLSYHSFCAPITAPARAARSPFACASSLIAQTQASARSGERVGPS